MKPSAEIYIEEYRGIKIEVKRHWNYEGTEVWYFYLHLLVNQFPKEHHEDLWQLKITSDYGSKIQPYPDCLQGLDWHYGMTWYSRESLEDDALKCIKAGCDYNHYWDEGHYYSANSVMEDGKKCVDSLFLIFPTLKTSKEVWDEYFLPFNEKMALKAKTENQL